MLGVSTWYNVAGWNSKSNCTWQGLCLPILLHLVVPQAFCLSYMQSLSANVGSMTSPPPSWTILPSGVSKLHGWPEFRLWQVFFDCIDFKFNCMRLSAVCECLCSGGRHLRYRNSCHSMQIMAQKGLDGLYACLHLFYWAILHVFRQHYFKTFLGWCG